jgi:alanine dehydrogenase
VVIVGGGVVGKNAAIVAAGAGAQVTVFDPDRLKQEDLRQIGPNVNALYPFPELLAEAVSHADLLIGAVLITGHKAPHIISREMLKNMPDGGVVVDVAVDQGGCIETTRPTTYADPTYVEEDILHFGVTNMPGAVPHSASQALSASLLPYVLKLAQPTWRSNEALLRGINVDKGQVVYPALK